MLSFKLEKVEEHRFNRIFSNPPPPHGRIDLYTEQDRMKPKRSSNAQFSLGNNTFIMMNYPIANQFDISPAISFIFTCRQQEKSIITGINLPREGE